MENPAKKMKIDASNEQNSEDFGFFDEMPDEILEKIIKFVHGKKNCFLVNQRFNQEATNATRNRLILKLDPDVCVQSVMKSNRSFVEIQWKYLSFTWKIYRIFEKTGSRIEQLTMRDVVINAADLLTLLNLMSNLVELNLNVYIKNQLRHCPYDIVHLPVLKKLIIDSSSLLSKLSCPVLEKFVSTSIYETDSTNFVRRHSQLKDISTYSSYGLSLDHLMLNSLALCRSSDSFLCSTIEKQRDLKSFTLSSTHMTNQSLRQIVTLQNLESLSIELSQYEQIPKDLLEKLSNMPRLKSLAIKTSYQNAIRSLGKIKHPQLEEFSLSPLSSGKYLDFDVLQALARNFPNLKKLSVIGAGFYSIISTVPLFKKLESLKTMKRDDRSPREGLDTKDNVRKLEMSGVSSSMIDDLIKVMPNVEKVSIWNPTETDSVSMNQILRFEKLTEFECSANFFFKPRVIKTIKERGSKIKKLIILDGVHYDMKQLHSAYSDQFPLMKTNLIENKITMSRM